MIWVLFCLFKYCFWLYRYIINVWFQNGSWINFIFCWCWNSDSGWDLNRFLRVISIHLYCQILIFNKIFYSSQALKSFGSSTCFFFFNKYCYCFNYEWQTWILWDCFRIIMTIPMLWDSFKKPSYVSRSMNMKDTIHLVGIGKRNLLLHLHV